MVMTNVRRNTFGMLASQNIRRMNDHDKITNFNVKLSYIVNEAIFVKNLRKCKYGKKN